MGKGEREKEMEKGIQIGGERERDERERRERGERERRARGERGEIVQTRSSNPRS